MNQLIIFFVSLFIIHGMLPCYVPTNKYLQLHFDVNKTIIATDAAQGKGLEETVNAILAEFTFHTWNGSHQQSFYAYATNLVTQKNPQLTCTDSAFKKERDNLLKKFPQYIQQYPKLYTKYEKEKISMLNILNKQQIVIFPAFYKLIDWLHEHYPHNYSIYLRTFGVDLPKIVPQIEKEKSVLKFAEPEKKLKDSKLIINEQEKSVIEFFTNHKSGNYAFQDDYDFWKLHKFQASGGKPFVVNIDNPHEITIFFDDNADEQERSILCPMDIHGNQLDLKMLLQRGNIVAVNPKEAILDDNYFIDKVIKMVTE